MRTEEYLSEDFIIERKVIGCRLHEKHRLESGAADVVRIMAS